MALLFMDGCDHCTATADAGTKWSTWNGGALQAAGGRFGGGGFPGTSSGNIRVVGSKSTLIVQVAFKLGTNTARSLVAFSDGGTVQVDVNYNGTNLQVRRNASTVLGTGTKTFSLGVWYYLEIKVTISDASGVAVVKVDGVTDINLSSVDTKQTSNASADRVTFAGTTSDVWDDPVIMDDSGAQNNDFLGDCRIGTIFPDAEGFQNDFTPSTGTDNSALVDEGAPNGDTDYVESSTPNHIDLYSLQSSSLGGNVKGLQINIYAKKTDAGTREIAPMIRRSSTNYQGDTKTLTTTYAYHSQIYELDPSTSAAWTESNINAGEFGAKLVT